MSVRRPIGVGVIGLGFMGRTHLRAWLAARDAGWPCRVAALADTRAEAVADASREFFGSGRESPTVHASPTALLADPEVDVVSVCTPTDSHVSLGLAALTAGRHALIEKPLALTADALRPLADAAGARPDTICMPAMCVRYWPGWDWLLARVREGSLGPVRSAVLQRLGARPAWGGGFYADDARSGGALVDFHIHDVDMMMQLFGAPKSVSCAGSLEHVTTQYRFAAGPAHATAEAGWTLAPGAPFRMRFLVCFEGFTAEFELGRTPTLRVYGGAGEAPHDPPLLPITGYDAQVKAFLGECLRRLGRDDEAPEAPMDSPRALPTVAEALSVARTLDAERLSLVRGETIRLD